MQNRKKKTAKKRSVAKDLSKFVQPSKGRPQLHAISAEAVSHAKHKCSRGRVAFPISGRCRITQEHKGCSGRYGVPRCVKSVKPNSMLGCSSPLLRNSAPTNIRHQSSCNAPCKAPGKCAQKIPEMCTQRNEQSHTRRASTAENVMQQSKRKSSVCRAAATVNEKMGSTRRET